MSLVDLEDRFLANIQNLYHRYKANDKGDGTIVDQPFVSILPDNPNRNITQNDTYANPSGSVKWDTQRINKFLASPEGQTFLANQKTLQSANTFAETIPLNNNFITSNIAPFVHATRDKTNATKLQLIDIAGNASPDSYASNVGLAGRLQFQTAANAIMRVMGNSTNQSNLLSNLSVNSIINSIGTALSTYNTNIRGPEGVDTRPELNVDGAGEYYSIALWKGFVRNYSLRSNVQNTIRNLANGNFQAAGQQALSGLTSALGTKLGFLTVPLGAALQKAGFDVDGRDDPYSNELWGRRYFITDANNADTYLANSVQYDTDANNNQVPIPQLSYLERQPYLLGAAPTDNIPFFGNLSSFAPSNLNSLGNFISSQSLGFSINSSQATQALRSPFGNLLNNVSSPISSFIPSILSAIGNSTLSDNPAEDQMLFSDLSLHQRYTNPDPNDASINFLQKQLAAQQTAGKKYWAQNQSKTGFVGGITAGQVVDTTHPQIRASSGRYFHDKLNDIGVIDNAGTTAVSNQIIQNIQKNYGTDLVQVMFFDFVNKKAVPFRAFIFNILENVNAEVTDTRYVGRIERNIVYTGVTRELSFGLYVHAMNDSEMINVWNKINYLTGLLYPADYQTGYMVPPLIKLTIGDAWRDQPGYIRTLNKQFEDDTPWETTYGLQVPHGILMNITFEIIEKTQIKTPSFINNTDSSKGLVPNDLNVIHPFGIPRTNPSQNNT